MEWFCYLCTGMTTRLVEIIFTKDDDDDFYNLLVSLITVDAQVVVAQVVVWVIVAAQVIASVRLLRFTVVAQVVVLVTVVAQVVAWVTVVAQVKLVAPLTFGSRTSSGLIYDQNWR